MIALLKHFFYQILYCLLRALCYCEENKLYLKSVMLINIMTLKNKIDEKNKTIQTKMIYHQNPMMRIGKMCEK